MKKEKSFLDSVSDSLLLRLPLANFLAAQFFPSLQQDNCEIIVKYIAIFLIYIYVVSCATPALYKSNKLYSDNTREITFNNKSVTAYYQGINKKFDNKNGHYHYVSADLLYKKINKKPRYTSLYIPVSQYNPQVLIFEEEIEEISTRDMVSICLIEDNTNTINKWETTENSEGRNQKPKLIIIKNRYERENEKDKKVIDKIAIDYNDKSFITDIKFDWVERSKLALFFRRTLYIVTVPTDIVISALGVAIIAVGLILSVDEELDEYEQKNEYYYYK